MKNIKSTNNTSNTTNKALTAWALEIDGEICPNDIVRTRSFARSWRNEVAEVYGSDAKVSVRKVLIVPVAGR